MNSTNIKAIISDRTVIVFVDGQTYTVDNSFEFYDALIDAIHKRDNVSIHTYIDKFKAMCNYTKDIKGLVITKDSVSYNGTKLHGKIIDTIIAMIRASLDYAPLEKFLQNIMDNPSEISRQELLLFLDTGDFPITTDGCFLAYKKVRENYRDIYTGTIDHSIGQAPSMPRDKVDPDRNRTCSVGFHFCSYDYLRNFGYHNETDKIMIVKINPKDVVAIPADYRNTKGRTWTYEVVDEVTTQNARDYMNLGTTPVRNFEQREEPKESNPGRDWRQVLGGNEADVPQKQVKSTKLTKKPSKTALNNFLDAFNGAPTAKAQNACAIAKFMAARPNQEITMRELTNVVFADSSAVNKAMKILEAASLVEKTKVGVYKWIA